MADRRADLGGGREGLAAHVGELLLHLVQARAELRVGDLQRSVAQPVPDLVDAVDHLVGQVPHPRGDLVADERDQRGDPEHAEHDDQEGRDLAGQAQPLQPRDHRARQGGEEQGDHDGQDDDEEQVEQVEDDRARGADDHEAPGPGCSEVHAVGHAGRREVRGPADDLRLRLHRSPAGADLGPLAGDPLPQLEVLALGLLGRGLLTGTGARAPLADQLPGVSSHSVRLRARAAAATGRRSTSRPTAAST